MIRVHWPLMAKLGVAACAALTLQACASTGGAGSGGVAGWPDIDGVWFTDAPASFRGASSALLPPYDAIHAATRQALAEGRPAGDATTDCFPAGMPRVMLAPYPMEIRTTRDQVTILFEYMQQVMRVHMDGRSLPEDPDPGYMGYSVGHWEGDTLVVRTVGRNGLTQLDGGLTPHSDKLTLELRLHRDGDELTVTTIATDPEAFREPVTSVKVYELRNDIEIMEYNCVENNRNPSDADGNTLFILRDEQQAPEGDR